MNENQKDVNYLKEYLRIMNNTKRMALATSIDNIPNVRIVDLYFDENKQNVIYFSTFKGSQKLNEFVQNQHIAFTTVPTSDSSEHVRSNQATVHKSELTVYDIKDVVFKTNPNYDKILEHAGPMIELFEIHFGEVNVILGVGQASKITL